MKLFAKMCLISAGVIVGGFVALLVLSLLVATATSDQSGGSRLGLFVFITFMYCIFSAMLAYTVIEDREMEWNSDDTKYFKHAIIVLTICYIGFVVANVIGAASW